mmetsp:Transcript_115840/g.327749  ORF Transcript_115840/g.327749 Transcript_115840/m.327749 type:complete len:215 (-) Transcript_115840:62-706(-)
MPTRPPVAYPWKTSMQDGTHHAAIAAAVTRIMIQKTRLAQWPTTRRWATGATSQRGSVPSATSGGKIMRRFGSMCLIMRRAALGRERFQCAQVAIQWAQVNQSPCRVDRQIPEPETSSACWQRTPTGYRGSSRILITMVQAPPVFEDKSSVRTRGSGKRKRKYSRSSHAQLEPYRTWTRQELTEKAGVRCMVLGSRTSASCMVQVDALSLETHV